jgi:hypothetical protein
MQSPAGLTATVPATSICKPIDNTTGNPGER